MAALCSERVTMVIFDKFKKMTIAHRKSDEALYSIVAHEMEAGVKHNGLWLKALQQADGNTERQVAEYIKLRVQSLKDDMSILSESFEVERSIAHDRDIEEFVTILSKGNPLETVEVYFSGMSSQEIYEFVNQPDACEDYPIHIAIKKGRVDIARWLLMAGANPLLKNYWGKTALEIAEQNEDEDSIALFQQYVT